MNWHQIGSDFSQKYNGTYCRYTSPLTNKCDIFKLIDVDVHDREPPDLTLFSTQHGEVYLKYTTEAELDFSFPPIGYFQHDRTALRLVKNYERQWKKGICNSTCHILFPYDFIYEVYFPEVRGEHLAAAFMPFERKSLTGAKDLLDRDYVSVALTKTLALGVGHDAKQLLLWFENDPIAELNGNKIELKVPDLQQEVMDFLRDTGDHVHTLV